MGMPTKTLGLVASLAMIMGATTMPAHARATAVGAPAVGETVLVSAAADGTPGDRPADRPEISGNGRYVTFDSSATNLVPGVAGGVNRVYRKDLATGEVALVSVGDDETPASAWSSYSSPDTSGNLVTFVSDATDLTAVPTTTRSVFLRDLSAGTTELISVGIDGAAANGASSRGMLVGDGRFVAFSSFASNLTASGGNGQEQVYLRDRVAGTTRLVSVSTSGGLGNTRSYRGMVSADGRYVAFASFATNLVSGSNPAVESVFLRDLVTGVTTRVTNRPSGQPSTIGGSRPYLSPDAHSVVFNSYDGLVTGDTNGKSDVYVYDVQRRTMQRQSPSVSGGNGNGDSLRGFVSDDSRYSLFNSFSSNLVSGDTNAHGDVFLRDRSTGQTSLVSSGYDGSGATGQSFRPVMSGDASVVSYLSEARNLVAGDTSAGYQVYAVSGGFEGRASPDTVVPRVKVTSRPRARASGRSRVVLRGVARDDRLLRTVQVRVRDRDAGRWLRANGSWGRKAQWLSTALAEKDATSTTWRRQVRLRPSRYRVIVKARDAAGLRSTATRRNLTVRRR